MNEVILNTNSALPATIEGLNTFIIIGKERLNAQKAKIRAIDKANLAVEAREAALADAQDMADILLDAEVRLGEILKTVPLSEKRASSAKELVSLPANVTKKQSHQAQTLSQNPHVVERVKETARQAGEIPTSAMVYKLVKTEEARVKVEDIRQRRAASVDGMYDVIVIDPPWPMEKIERDCRPNQHGFDYPIMSLEEIENLAIPAAADCHLFLWTTHKFLPAALPMIKQWGFRYVCLFTWHKPGGFQPIGLPQYNSEFVIYARKGSPKFVDTKAFNTCFDAPRGTHSEKPAEFYGTIVRVTEGRRLDMFSRKDHEGFYGWGNEALASRQEVVG